MLHIPKPKMAVAAEEVYNILLYIFGRARVSHQSEERMARGHI